MTRLLMRRFLRRNVRKASKIVLLALILSLFLGGCTVTENGDLSLDSNNQTEILDEIKGEDLDSNKDSQKNDKETESSKEESDSKEENPSNQSNSSKPTDKEEKPFKSVGTGKYQTLSLSSIPAYSKNAYVVINNNIPNFSSEELKSVGYEKYIGLDDLGRTRMAIASVGKDTMPKKGEERGSISSIKPSGWMQEKYDNISGKYLYNRCHLIGWQLSAENANKGNLITGTKYLNIEGMLPFENMVADYVKETGNHVAYRITPIYDGNNLLASGVEMEAYSVEDNGKGICFHVYCYNVQPGIKINYKDGSSSSTSSSSNSSSSSKPSDGTSNSGNSSSINTETTKPSEPVTEIVYTTKTGKKYHSTKGCSGLSNANQIFETKLSDAKNKGLEPCKKCH